MLALHLIDATVAVFSQEAFNDEAVDMLRASTQAQKVGTYKILCGKAAERSWLASHFRLGRWHIFPGKCRLVRGHEFIGAGHPRQGEPLAARATKIVPHIAVAVHEPVYVPKV